MIGVIAAAVEVRPRPFDSVTFQHFKERTAGDAEEFRRLGAISSREFQGA